MNKPGVDASEEKNALRRSVLRVLERELESGRPFSWAVAAQHAVAVVLRTGGRRPRGEREHFEETMATVAAQMPDAIEPGALETFAEVAAEVGARSRPTLRHPGQKLNPAEALPRSPRALAKAAVYAEFAGAKSDDDLLQRAFTRAVRERKRARRGKRYVKLDDGDPVRKVLDLPVHGPAVVATGDVRGALVDGLAGLLKQAAPFSEVHVRAALGELLWAKCRPLGWADARHTRVLLEVPSSPIAHELGMQRRDIVRRLQRVPGFEKVKDVRFQIADKAFKVQGF